VSVDIKLLWEKKLTLLLFGLLGLGGGFLYISLVPTTFEAQARVLIEPRGVSPDSDPMGRVVPEFIPTQAETIRSPLIVAQAISSMDIAKPDNVPLESFDPVRHVLKSLNVTPLLNANVVTVTYRSTGETESTQLISEVISAYETHVGKTDRGSTGTKVQLLAASEQKQRDELRKYEKEYETLRQKTPVIGQGRTANQDGVIELELINRELVAIKSQRKEIESRLLAVLRDSEHRVLPPESAPDVLTPFPVSSFLNRNITPRNNEFMLTVKKPALDSDTQQEADSIVAGGERQDGVYADSSQIEQIIRYANPEAARDLQSLDQQFRFAVLKAEKLDAIYAASHPAMLAAKAEVDALEALLQQRFEIVLKSWQRELQGLLASELEFNGIITEKKAEIKATEIFQVQEENLLRNIENIRQLHASTLQQLIAMQGEESAISNGRNSIEIQVLDAPMILSDMTWPNPKMLLAASFFVGVLMGLGVIGLGVVRKSQVESRQRSASATTAATEDAGEAT